ncbi:F-box associated domain type 3 [Arabidopsis thaliana x Arabidopsis arenosa]|uniref:F-box associated domain type 3 n=1 Tax=Arabidopsis thaliana x Arabidopsis arenosa TaxID=1240361 RepID=A0A8T1ZHB7_9BRAS|nr:F-box associated domain type 3 [Arabidopsis thaliana x Arabidopsis arenosa]
MNSSFIKTNLIKEILSSNSVARFRCVSKRWASSMTRSSAKPRLLFAIAENGDYSAETCGVWSFFSSPQFENPYEKSSSTLVAAAEFHVKFSPENLRINHDSDIKYFSIGYAAGLIYIYGSRYQARPLICNPNTGRYAILPYRYTYRKAYSFFGFDPIDKQYKALSIRYPSGPGRNKILTFGDNGDLTWRKIKFPLGRPEIKSDGICINGVLYFLGRFCRLINYKGKLAVIYWEDDVDIYEICVYGKDLDEYLEENLDVDATNELHLWVLEDVEKKKWSKYTWSKYTWSKYAYTWTDDTFFRRHLSIAGATASGEIVFSMRKYTCKQPFYVFYFNPERNTLQRVEIQGFGEAFKETCSVRTFVNHVEDLDVNDLKQLKSVHPPLVEPEYYDRLESESESESESE